MDWSSGMLTLAVAAGYALLVWLLWREGRSACPPVYRRADDGTWYMENEAELYNTIHRR